MAYFKIFLAKNSKTKKRKYFIGNTGNDLYDLVKNQGGEKGIYYTEDVFFVSAVSKKEALKKVLSER